MSTTNFRKCDNCGATRDASDLFCGACGKPISNSAESNSTLPPRGLQPSPITPRSSDPEMYAPTQSAFTSKFSPRLQSNMTYLIGAGVLMVMLIGALFLGIQVGKGSTPLTAVNTRGGPNPVATSPVNTTPTANVAAPTSTPTPLPPAGGTVLYQANWSNGSDGWALGPHWTILNGILINDGNDSYSNWLAAPYQPDRNDYAVESEMRIDRGCNSHGVVARAVGSNNYAGGAYCGGGDVEIWLWTDNAHSHQSLATKNLNASTGWHTFRLEVKGNILRLLIDKTLMVETLDNTIHEGGLVGLWSDSEQLEVRSFKVIAL